MMIGAWRDEDKNVSAADSAELAEKEWEGNKRPNT